MENLSRSGGEGRAIKCSTRDLPLVASYDHGLGETSDENARWGGKHVTVCKSFRSCDLDRSTRANTYRTLDCTSRRPRIRRQPLLSLQP
jgi:hypothetical protein